MIALVSQKFSITTQLSFNLSPKQWLSKLPKPDKRALFPSLYSIIVKNYKTIIVPNNILNAAHPIAVAKANPQPKDQMHVVLPLKLMAICRPKHVCLTWGLTRGRSKNTYLTCSFTKGCSTYACLTWGITKYRTTNKGLIQPSYIAWILLVAYSPASCVVLIVLVQFSIAPINSDYHFRTYFDPKTSNMYNFICRSPIYSL